MSYSTVIRYIAALEDSLLLISILEKINLINTNSNSRNCVHCNQMSYAWRMQHLFIDESAMTVFRFLLGVRNNEKVL